jgi:hypothetical protein
MASTSDYESSDPGSIPGWVPFKWHAQNKLLSSSLIVIGSSPWFTPPSNQRTIVAARLVLFVTKE